MGVIFSCFDCQRVPGRFIKHVSTLDAGWVNFSSAITSPTARGTCQLVTLSHAVVNQSVTKLKIFGSHAYSLGGRQKLVKFIFF